METAAPPMNWLADAVRIGSGNFEGKTGHTVFAFNKPLAVAYLLLGSAPASRDLLALQPGCAVQKVHGMFLSGSSAFGLDACAGLMQYQRERGIGLVTAKGLVPVIPTACIFDEGVSLHIEKPEIISAQFVHKTAVGSVPFAPSQQPERLIDGVGAGARVSKFAEGIYGPCTSGAAAVCCLSVVPGIHLTCRCLLFAMRSEMS
eukprot:GHVS01101701.1.p1 GENE.GHVS01101701.1~~GHVS01101701.1.p1  ORF type:complete len:203 (+),score=25.57 GHVS01101701.1:209-817(+)